MVKDDEVNGKILYQDDDHKFIWLGADPQAKKGVVQTNQYLIIDGGKGFLLDPGGIHLFSRVVSVVSRFTNIDKIDTIFFSHQDPDVSSGIALWLGISDADIYVSELWIRFLPHFGIVDLGRVKGIESSEQNVILPGGSKIHFIPAHFLHSAGNFCLYDERAKILFSADIGAAVFDEEQYLFVKNFEEHKRIMEPFHKRYMTGNKACKKWVDSVSHYDIDMIAPQHGAVFEGELVPLFLDWFAGLNCGIDRIDEVYP